MSKHIWLQIIAVVVLCVVALLLLRLHSAGGQPPHAGHPASRGEGLVRAWCLQCHSIGRLAEPTHPDLNFSAIANMPSTTQMSLNAFLQSSHRNMPNLILKPQERNDIIAFILSLRKE